MKSKKKNNKEKIKGLKWYWKLLLTIPIVFFGILLSQIINYFFEENIDITFYDYILLGLKNNFLAFLIIFVVVNTSSLFFKKESKGDNE